MLSTPQTRPAAPSGADFPIEQDEAHHAGSASCALMVRVGRVLQDMNAGRAVTDEEIRQHEADCRRLSTICYERFQQSGNLADRDDAVLWQARAAEAHHALSPAWKAARDAEILRAAEGTGCYFMDQADAARLARVGRRGA